jgi:hypothetical protein
MPPLKPNATVPVPAPTETFFDRSALGALDGSEHVLPRDVPLPDVIQVSVVRFADRRSGISSSV